jgi:hypothetical protein
VTPTGFAGDLRDGAVVATLTECVAARKQAGAESRFGVGSPDELRAKAAHAEKTVDDVKEFRMAA